MPAGRASGGGSREVIVGKVKIGGGNPLVLIGGPCAIEDEAHALMLAERLPRAAVGGELPLIFNQA